MQTPTIALPRISWRSVSVAVTLLLALSTCSPSSSDQAARLASTTASDGTTSPTVPATPALSDAPALRATAGDAAEPTDDVDAAGGSPATQEPSPQPVLDPASLPEKVELHEPDLVVRADGAPLPSSHDDIKGAGYLASVRELTATTADREGRDHDLELLAVDPVAFRPFTPDVTAQSRAVWERLDDGDVLVRHDVAHQLGLELGEHIELEGERGTMSVRVGALAANGAPPFADVIVPFEVAANLGSPGVNAVVVASAEKVEPEPLADRLESLGDVEVRRPPEPERTTSRPTNGSVELEPFTYTSRGDGTIAIHGDWVQRNIVTVQIPRMGTTRCHREMVPQLYAALQEIIDEGLYDHLRPEQFGGCWVPRHILWNPSRGLSMHSWGLAIDFNVQDNWYGDEPQMDPRIVQIFKKWGFEWGGDWSTPDGMHFEVDRFVQVE